MNTPQASLLDAVPLDLPELVCALELQRTAAQVGFDWGSLPPVLAKVQEELGELEDEVVRGASPERILDELGDLLFAIVNLARKLGLDPQTALRSTNSKFRRRFSAVERQLAQQGRQPQAASLAEMDALWERAKQEQG